jgi:hypothetical protein
MNLLQKLNKISNFSDPDKVVAQINPPKWIIVLEMTDDQYEKIKNQLTVVFRPTGGAPASESHLWEFSRTGGKQYIIMLREDWLTQGRPTPPEDILKRAQVLYRKRFP